MLNTSAAQPETIENLANAVYPSFAMLAGMQLDLFTALKGGPMNPVKLAKELGVPAAKLEPLLYALVGAKLLKVDKGCFSNSDEANHFLVQDLPTYMGGRHKAFSRQWNGLLKTAESIRSGTPQAKIDFSAMPPEELDSFYGGLHSAALAAGRDLVARYDFSTYRSMVDVAGGSGGLAIAVTERRPNIRATVIDLPAVTPFTRHYVKAAGAEDRVNVEAGDVVNHPLRGIFDVAVLRNFIQVLSPDHAHRALLHVSKIVVPGGLIYVLGCILDDSRLSPPQAVGSNLNFLNIYEEGQAYTEREYNVWLREAGFTAQGRIVLPNGTSIMTAQRVANGA